MAGWREGYFFQNFSLAWINPSGAFSVVDLRRSRPAQSICGTILLTSTNYVSKPFNSPNFKFWKGENAAPIIFSGGEVNKHVWRCEQTPTWQGLSSQVSVCSENSVCEHFEDWHLAFRTTAPNACYPCTFLCQNRKHKYFVCVLLRK